LRLDLPLSDLIPCAFVWNQADYLYLVPCNLRLEYIDDRVYDRVWWVKEANFLA
jgi:hypothetical protein